MKINNVQNYQITKTPQSYKYTEQPTSNGQQPQTSNILPTTAQYLAFTGGYSLNLAETIRQLDKFAEKNSSVYPKNIREWAGMILSEGNKAKENLIDIHKRYFSNLKECTSLEEIKSRFPEFEGVISSKDVNCENGSFIDAFKKGELEYFDNDEDLSVQLIKLYWGEGFSLNDLKRYSDGKDLYYTMKKLNIPRADKNYGHILKFSDAEYNERLAKKMTEKRLAALDRKAQMEDGEPVYIKRGPLSEEHNQRISEELIKHYSENPEKIYQMSERQKEFYRNNPEKAEEFSRVVKMAWNIFGADRIKAALAKFLKSKKIDSSIIMQNPLKLTKDQSEIMKQFWGQNEWARKSFSKNMEHAWKKEKEDQNKFFIIDITPDKFKENFYKWADKKNINLKGIDFNFKVYKHKPELDEGFGNELSKYTPKFIDDYSEQTGYDQSSMMANTYMITLMKISKELKKILNKNISESTRHNIEITRKLIKDTIFDHKNGHDITLKIHDAQEIQEIYKLVLFYNMKQNNAEQFIKLFKKLLDETYIEMENLKGKPPIVTDELVIGVLK